MGGGWDLSDVERGTSVTWRVTWRGGTSETWRGTSVTWRGGTSVTWSGSSVTWRGDLNDVEREDLSDVEGAGGSH